MIKKHINYSISQFYRIKFKFVRFLFVGALNTLFSLTVYWILVYFGVHYSLAVLIATALGILFNYKTTGKLVFETNDNKFFIKFAGVYIIIYFLNVGFLKMLFVFGIDKYTAAVITALPLSIISFFLMKKFVYRLKK